jgi:hypothetical protein
MIRMFGLRRLTGRALAHGLNVSPVAAKAVVWMNSRRFMIV